MGNEHACGRARLLVNAGVLEGSAINQSLRDSPSPEPPSASYWWAGEWLLVVYYNFIILILMALF